MRMTENLSASQAKWLTYLVWILMTILTGTTIFQFTLISGQNAEIKTINQRVTSYHHPEKYVTLERYSSDMARFCVSLDRVDAKLDRLIEKLTK